MRARLPESWPFHYIRYLNAAKRGGSEVCRLPVSRGKVQGLLGDTDALIIAADLQGIVPGPGGEAALLGVAVAEAVEELLCDSEFEHLSHIGVILAGDLYSVPEANKRGGFGDVTEVWKAFGSRFDWVAGVLGNHDAIARSSFAQLTKNRKVHLLDGDAVEIEGMSIGGVGLISGNPAKPGRREERDQLAQVELVAERKPDLLILHEGPNGSTTQPGNPEIRKILEQHGIAFSVCGHVHWEEPLADTSVGQILNCDARVMILERE